MGSTHAMAGFVIWFSMVRANISPPLGIIAVVLGSLLPDIDHPNGTLRQMMDLPKLLKQPISEIIPHRGPTHSIWAGILFSLLTISLAAWGGNPILLSIATLRCSLDTLLTCSWIHYTLLGAMADSL